MNGSYTETLSIMEDSTHGQYQPSTRYISTLRSHSPSRRASSAISKTYKAASTLYLTRRLSEALHTIEPLVTATKPGVGSDEDEEVSMLPPIATATRSLRIKVWNFYLTLLNAIIELGPEDGKADFGSAVWRGIVSRVRDGSVWEEVVANGYGGREGSVDADVVANLATLLLGQSPSQELNQQRLETYLSLSGQPELALADRLNGFPSEDGGATRREPPEMQRRPSHASGTNTPRDLNSRAKVLELYTLHVLPRNDEWETSREFIRNSNELDEERKDAFLYTLDTLQDQAQTEHNREQELLRERDEELARQRAEAEAKRLEESRLLDEKSRAASEAASRASEVASQASSSRGVTSSKATQQQQQHQHQHNRTNSEVDYGIDDTKVRKPLRKKESTSRALRASDSGGTGTGSGGGGAGGGKGLPRAARPKKAPPKSVVQRIPVVLRIMQRLLANAVKTMTSNPQVLTRNLLFLIALLLAFANKGVRERVGRITGIGWDKIKATVGMGTKVSYI